MSIPSFSEWPDIPQRSAPEADFDAKMYALFQHFATTHRNEMLAFINFLENNSTVINGALNGTTIGLNTPAAGKFTTLQADSLGGAAVQSGAMDSTDGRLWKSSGTNGAFGLGAIHAPNCDDANLLTVSGLYRTVNDTVNTPVSSWGHTILHQQFDQNNATQLFSSGSGDKLFFRRKRSGTWQAWTEVYSSKNIVGTVSQSGGVATGAVIEQASNANGSYVRFADGTQICYRFSVGIDSTSGTTIALPAAFATAAISVNVTPIHTQPIIAVTSDRSTTSFKLYAFSADGTPVASLGCAMVVFGRWY